MYPWQRDCISSRMDVLLQMGILQPYIARLGNPDIQMSLVRVKCFDYSVKKTIF